MPGVRNKKLKSGSYQGWYFDYRKKQTFFKGTTSKRQTYNIAIQKEKIHHELWLKGETPSKLELPIETVLKDYFTWGCSHGGKRGNPWSKEVFQKKQTHLNWWVDNLKINVIGDLQKDILFKCEKAIQDYRKDRTGKTVYLRIEALSSFISWCIKNEILTQNKIKRITKFDKSPDVERRALTIEEFKKICEVSSIERKILYELAVNSGLRANELQMLSVDDLTPEGIRLYKWTKNRETLIQPLHPDLIKKLKEFSKLNIPEKCYQKAYRNKALPFIPKKPLVYVSTHPERYFKQDAIKAGVKIKTSEGKIDFHALRTTFVTWTIENGANLKEAQELARHSDINLTSNIYAKVRAKRKQDILSNMFSLCSSENDLDKLLSKVAEKQAVS